MYIFSKRFLLYCQYQGITKLFKFSARGEDLPCMWSHRHFCPNRLRVDRRRTRKRDVSVCGSLTRVIHVKGADT